MAYVKQNFVKGQILTAEHMNHIEDGIVAAADAQSLGGVAAGSYALKTDVAPDSTMLGGKAPEYYLQPMNLLDNSDFRIAQAGYGGLHGTQKYACDRWYDTYGFGSFSFNESEGLTIAYGTNHAYLVQKINGASLLHGKTVTLAMQLSDGSVYAKSGVFVSDGASFIIDIATDKTLTLFSDRVEFVVTSGSMTIKWAALYEGSYTADTLPPYVPKGYAAELAQCKRYYNIIPYDMDDYYVNANTAYPSMYPVFFPEMRIVPTVTLQESWNVGSAGVSVGFITKNSLAFQAAATSSRVAWHGKIKLNADL